MRALNKRVERLEQKQLPPVLPLVAWEDSKGKYIVNSPYYGINDVMTDKELTDFTADTEIKLIKITWAD